MKTIDLRSDTVTKPTQAMRDAMYSAIVGDDVFGEDPTVIQLEKKVAQMFGKKAGLFFPSGTMSNLAAILAWCPNRGSEIVVGDKSHIFLFEQASAAQFGGISYRTIPNLPDGSFEFEDVLAAIREDDGINGVDIHEPATTLVCTENTHNVCGGKIVPITFMKKLHELCSKVNKKSIPIHMDGARIWNAIEGSGVTPELMGKYADSISVCLSKGLGAPAGSILLGTSDFIRKARRCRKALGGGMRQSGILAAAGLQAIADFEDGILTTDHRHARLLAEEMAKLRNVFVDFTHFRIENAQSNRSNSFISAPELNETWCKVDSVDTNIIFATISNTMSASVFVSLLNKDGISDICHSKPSR
jgi:threonine aldolase